MEEDKKLGECLATATNILSRVMIDLPALSNSTGHIIQRTQLSSEEKSKILTDIENICINIKIALEHLERAKNCIGRQSNYADKTSKITRKIKCPTCGQEASVFACATCEGAGILFDVHNDHFNVSKCKDCDGTGIQGGQVIVRVS